MFGSKLVASTSSTVVLAGVFAAKSVQDMYPPQSEAPKIGTLVTKTFSDGTQKEYRVISATGHHKSVCAEIKRSLELNSVRFPLYHSSNLKVPQSYARQHKENGAIAYIGIDPDFPDQLPQNRFMETAPHLQTKDTRYENSGFFPLRVDALNDEVDSVDLCPSYDGERIKPDVQIVYIEDLNDENMIGVLPSINRMFKELSVE